MHFRRSIIVKNYLVLAFAGVCLWTPGCSHKKFQLLATENPGFAPDTAFIGYEDLSNLAFKNLKERYKTDTIFHGEADELKRILLLRHWIHQAIPIDNTGPYPGNGSVESILDEALKGHGFHCGHYTAVQNALLNAYGYITRCLLADVGVPVDQVESEGHHAINEVWLNSYHKWFMSDAKYDYHFEKNRIPLSALEIRDEYFKNKAADITLVKGPDRVPTATYPELKNRGKEKFARIYTWVSWGKYNNRYSAKTPVNTDYMLVLADDYFNTHTWLWDGKPLWAYNTEYMQRVKERAAIEWTPNTIASKLTLEDDRATVELASITPNLETYQMKTMPVGEWKDINNKIQIDLKQDTNRIGFRAQNAAGIPGPEHHIIIAR